MKKKYKIGLLVSLDAISVTFIYIFAIFLRFDFSLFSPQAQEYLSELFQCIVFLVPIKLGVFAFMGLYNSLWRYASLDEMAKIVAGALFANFATMSFMAFSLSTLPRSVYFIATVLDIVVLGMIRISYRYFRNRRAYGRLRLLYQGEHETFWNFLKNRNAVRGKRLMLVGAGDAGAAMIKEVRMHAGRSRRVVVAVDDDLQKRNQMLYNVKIAGSRYDIPDLALKYEVDEIIVTIPSLNRRELGKNTGRMQQNQL